MPKHSTRLLTVLSAALLTSAGAQTSTSATRLQPGQPPLTMPLDVQLLPVNTVTITPGTYYIPDYEQTGISVYLQSPHPLTVASLDQMLKVRAEWTRLMAGLSGASVPARANVVKAAPVQAVPVAAPASPTATAGTTFPAAKNVFAAPAAADAGAFPKSKNAFDAPLSAAQSAFPNSKNAFGGVRAAPAPSLRAASPVAAAMAPAPTTSEGTRTTLMPSYVDMKWRGRGGVVTAYITNLNPTQRLKIDPASLRVYQNGAPLRAQLSVRDSSGATQPSELLPRSMFTVLVQVTPGGSGPLTLTWEARDDAGTVYPIRYSWLPQ